MTPKRVTLKQIAQEAGCSTAVVSTVLNKSNGNTKVSDKTRQRIKEIAESFNYHPNFASRSLKMSKTKTLGIYVNAAPWRQLGNAYEMQMFRGIEMAAREKGYDLLLINIGGDVSPEVCASKMAEHRVDGVLLIHVEPGLKWLNELVQLTSHLVAVDFCGIQPGLDAMMFDNNAAIEIALEHLKQLGHKRIGFIGPCLKNPPLDAAQRIKAFKIFSEKLKLDNDPALIFDISKSPEPILIEDQYCQQEGRLGADYFFNMKENMPSAILCYNDLVAVEAMRRFSAHGLSLPGDMSILGIDNSERCEYTIPALTSVKHPLEQMGYEGTSLLIEKTEGRTSAGDVHRFFAPELIVRDSTLDLS